MPKLDLRGILVYLGILALTLFVLSGTFTGETVQALKAINPLGLVPLFLLWFTGISSDSLGLYFFLVASGHRVGLNITYKNTFIRLFFNLMTPFSFGGQPFTVFALSREGVAPGKGTSAVLAKLVVISITSMLVASIALLAFQSRLASIPALGSIFIMTGVLGLLGVGILLLSLVNPAPLLVISERILLFIAEIFKRFGRSFDTHLARKKLLYQWGIARRCFRTYFKQKRKPFLLGALFTALQHICNISLLWGVLQFLGIPVAYFDGFVLGGLLLFLISFLPTPGSSGLGEALFVALLAGQVPVYLIGVATILWRTFNQYISAVLGSFVSAGHIRAMLTTEVSTK